MSQRPGSSVGGRKAGGAQRVLSALSRHGDAAQVHGVEQERTDVDVFAPGIGGDLLGDGALGATRSSPQDHRLAGLDQEREGGGEFARAERVVGGDGVGIGHGQDSGMTGMGRRGPPGSSAFAPPGAALGSSCCGVWRWRTMRVAGAGPACRGRAD